MGESEEKRAAREGGREKKEKSESRARRRKREAEK
jgi:hypothetical protein